MRSIDCSGNAMNNHLPDTTTRDDVSELLARIQKTTNEIKAFCDFYFDFYCSRRATGGRLTLSTIMSNTTPNQDSENAPRMPQDASNDLPATQVPTEQETASTAQMGRDSGMVADASPCCGFCAVCGETGNDLRYQWECTFAGKNRLVLVCVRCRGKRKKIEVEVREQPGDETSKYRRRIVVRA